MPSTLRFGAHMPTAGGLYKAIHSGAKIGCDAVQLFTASPRQWKAAPPDRTAIHKFRRAVEATGIGPLIAHDSYLINLATQDPALLAKSRQAFLEEMTRAELLGLDFVVTHMGAHTGAGEEVGMAMLCDSLDWLHRQIPDYRVKVALETTAGQGTCLGGVFDHFPQIFAQVEDADRLAVCLDTCHIFVAGYDIRDAQTVRTTLDEFDAKVGLSRLCAIHANDAAKGAGFRTPTGTPILGKAVSGTTASPRCYPTRASPTDCLLLSKPPTPRPITRLMCGTYAVSQQSAASSVERACPSFPEKINDAITRLGQNSRDLWLFAFYFSMQTGLRLPNTMFIAHWRKTPILK